MSFKVSFDPVPDATPITVNNSTNQGFESSGVRFSGAVFDGLLIAGMFEPFEGKHVGAQNNRIVIEFDPPMGAFGLDVESGNPAQGAIGLSFRATFEGGATETFQFPEDPNATLGPPFNSTPVFAGFSSIGSSGKITMVEIFQSRLTNQEVFEPIPDLPSYPRVGNRMIISQVPEPTTAVLLGIGLTAVATLRRRRPEAHDPESQRGAEAPPPDRD